MSTLTRSGCAVVALLAGVAIAPPAFAQQANQPVEDCPTLQQFLDANSANLAEEQIRQADEAIQRGEAEGCVQISTQFQQAQQNQQAQGQPAAGQQPGQEVQGSNIVVQQPAPTVTVDPAAPQVTV